MSLFVFGVGYTAGHYLRERPEIPASGTVRTQEGVAALQRQGINAHRFDGETAEPPVFEALARAKRLLVSAQPNRGWDPVLARFEAEIAAAPNLSHIAYLSTVGVYGDHGGAWIDETVRPNPESERGRARLLVEDAWLDFGRRTGKTVTVLRLAGIYGPGRNALEDLRDGDARRIDKPGQVFNRIHVADISRAIDRAWAWNGPGQGWNIADDEPAPAPDVVAYAAGLIGVAPPPLVPFAEAPLSPMARSFYAANRRIDNRAMKQKLGVALLYPTYRAGLDALWASGAGRSEAAC